MEYELLKILIALTALMALIYRLKTCGKAPYKYKTVEVYYNDNISEFFFVCETLKHSVGGVSNLHDKVLKRNYRNYSITYFRKS